MTETPNVTRANSLRLSLSSQPSGVIPRMRSSAIIFLAVLMSLTFSRADDAERRTTKYFKGVELYSWRDPASDSWRFSLLPGTNRVKTLAEITDLARTITSVEELKKQLAHLAVGEYVTWNSTDSKKAYPLLPPKPVADDIAETAKTLQLNLYIPKP
jgi:hypothetical protein